MTDRTIASGGVTTPVVAPDTSDDPLLTVDQVARALKVGKQMVYRMLERGTLLQGPVQPRRVGRLWRVPRKELCEQYPIPEDHDFGPP